MDLPLAMAWQLGEPLDTDTERHGAVAGPVPLAQPCTAQSDSTPTHPAGPARYSTPQSPMGRAAPPEGHREEGEPLAVLPSSLNPGALD